MKRIVLIVLLFGLSVGLATASPNGLLNHDYRPLTGKKSINLAKEYKGKVVLVVNTASKCGFTPQFEGLEELYSTYKAQGFAVIGFPSGDFKEQEFQNEDEIREFCTLTYGVKFPMYQKVHVVGDEATRFYKQLKQVSGVEPKWNFHKYLIGRDGKYIANFDSKTKPDDKHLVKAIESALKANN